LRLGLIGAGMIPDRALTLVQRYVDDRPWSENVLPAQAVIIAAMIGVPGDELEKKEPAEQTKESRSTETVDSSAPSSTVSEPPSDSIPANSTT
jgi:hypothetical protein